VTVETILGGFQVRSVERRGLMLLSGLGAGLLCGAALLLGLTPARIVMAGASVAWVAAALVVFARSGLMIPVIVPLVLALAGWAAGLAIARRSLPYPHPPSASPTGSQSRS
jgi:hypothetical protein